MSDSAPNPELLRSLGRLVRGLSALFWGLPLALIVCVETVKAEWLNTYTIFPPLASTGLLLFGLWQLGSFQKQERPWRSALTRAELFALVNVGLSPFLYWWNRVPGNPFFAGMVCALAFSGLLFLFTLNLVLRRLGAMLPDEALRHEIRHYSSLNRSLLLALLTIATTYVLLTRVVIRMFPQIPHLPEHVNILSLQIAIPALGWQVSSVWLIWLLACLLVLLPLAMTMALLWKTKEVILENVFGGNRH